MLRIHYVLLGAICQVVWIGGCEQAPTPVDATTPDSNVVSDPLQFVESAPDSDIRPHYPEMELFVNNRQFGETNGCTVGFTTHAKRTGMQVTHESSCGHSGAVSRVTWKYLDSDDASDRYEVQRAFPVGEPNEAQQQVVIRFKGEPIVLFEDDVQRIVMQSKAAR